MATLFKKKNRDGKQLPNWYCTFQIPTKEGDSQQVHRSTGTPSKKDALDKARDLERDARKEASADDETAKAILSKLTEASELAMKGRLNPAHARRLLGEIMEASGEAGLVSYTLRKWIEEWLAEKTATTKPATTAFYRSSTNDFISFLGKRADNHIETITTKDVRDFRDSVIVRGRTIRTANQKLKCLRSVFGDAVKASALLHNPTSPIKTLDETDTIPRLPFAVEDVSALLDAAPCKEWRGMILLGAFTGMRMGDAANLKGGNLDLERQVINFTPRKSSRKGTVVEVPIHEEIVNHFKDNPPPPFAGASLFTSLAGKDTGGRMGLSNLFTKIMLTAGLDPITTETSEDGTERKLAKRSFHSLRHTFTSWLAKADVPEEVRMKMTGHTESKTHQKYTHQELSTLRAGVDKIPSIQK